MTLYGILLAAGEGSRFGQTPKLLAHCGERLLLKHSLDRLEALLPDRISVVLGARADALLPAIGATPYQLNPHWRIGLSASIKTGLAALPADASAVLIALADQPAVTYADFEHLVDTHRRTGRAVCAAFDNTLGVPAIIPRRFFNELQALQGDRGARGLLQQWQARGELVAIPLPAAALDVDTPADLSHINTLIHHYAEVS